MPRTRAVASDLRTETCDDEGNDSYSADDRDYNFDLSGRRGRGQCVSVHEYQRRFRIGEPDDDPRATACVVPRGLALHPERRCHLRPVGDDREQ